MFWMLVIPGLLLVPFGMAIIYKNEGKIVRIKGVLRYGKKQMKSDQDYQSASSSNNMELVHMKGITNTEGALEIPELNYARPNCYRISVHAEMFQKIEHKHYRNRKEGEKTVREVYYTYTDRWEDRFVDSSGYHDHRGCNPHVQWPIKSQTVRPDKYQVIFGDFRLAPE